MREAPIVEDQAAILRGRSLVLISGLAMSLGGVFVRSMETANEWQILLWRSPGVVAVLLLFMAARGGVGTIFAAAGGKSVLAGLSLALGSACYVFSITHTTVANTLFMLSAGPFIAAVLGRILLGEAVQRVTWVAMAGAAAGVAIMVADGVAGGALSGNIAGLGAAVGFAGFSVALRSGRGADMLPATCHAGLFSLLIGIVAQLLSGGGLMPSTADLGLCLTYGAIAVGGGLIVFTLGARHVPAAEASLLSMTEVVLGPIWVWLFFAETPSRATLAGGALLLASIGVRALDGMRRRRPPVGAV